MRYDITNGITSNGITLGTVDDSMHVSNGGIASNTIIKDLGCMYISSGGSANDTSLERMFGRMYIYEGGRANNTTIKYSQMHVDGGEATGTTVNFAGYLHVSAGGVATQVEINGGCVYVSSGGTASNTMVNKGSMYISSGGTATNIVAAKGGILRITVAPDTYIQGTSNGSAFEMKNAFIDGYTVDAQCSILVASGGTATDITIANGGMLGVTVAPDTYIQGTSNGSAFEMKDAFIAGHTIRNGEYMYIISGGTASETTVNDFGIMYVSSCGTAAHTTVNAGGKMYITPEGVHRGSLQIEKGSTVSADSDSSIDFTVVNRTSADGYLINDLSRIDGTPTYTVTISADQASGTYKLAQGASKIDGALSIYLDDDTSLGSLTINGDVLKSGDTTYDLNNVDGNLTLAISRTPPQPQPDKTIHVTVDDFNGIFALTSSGKGLICTAAGKKEVAGTLDVSIWEPIGSGDFNNSGSDGLLWLEKATGKIYIQDDLTNFNEVNNKSKYLGTLKAGQDFISTGDFTGTGFDCVLIQSPLAASPGDNDLMILGRDAAGAAFEGSAGTLCSTWTPGDPLQGNTGNLADISARNYMYDAVMTGDFDGDGVDDVLVQNGMPATVNGSAISGSGDVFTFLTAGSAGEIKTGTARPAISYAGNIADGWEIIGVGDFDGDKVDDVLLSDDSNVSGWLMEEGGCVDTCSFTKLSTNEKIIGVTDLNNDGTDDLVVLNTATDVYSGWLVKDGAVSGTIALA